MNQILLITILSVIIIADIGLGVRAGHGLDISQRFSANLNGVTKQPKQQQLSAPPVPSQLTRQCLNPLTQELIRCRKGSLRNWNITDYSSLADVCCAQWDNIECDLDIVAKSNCKPGKQYTQTIGYFDDLIEFYNTNTCRDYPRGGQHCLMPMIRSLAQQKQQLDNNLKQTVDSTGAAIDDDSYIADDDNDANDDDMDMDRDNPNPKMDTGLGMELEIEMDDNLPAQPMPDPLALDCFGSLNLVVRVGCRQVAWYNWNITQHSRPPVRNVCCATWDDIDCLDQVARVRCPKHERVLLDNYFAQLEKWAENVACGQARYHSKNCTRKSNNNNMDLAKFQQQQQQQNNQADLANDDQPSNNVINVEFQQEEISLIFPAKHDIVEQQQQQQGDQLMLMTQQDAQQFDADYRDFVLNYMMTVLPHLLNLLALLAVILVTVVCVQCFLMARQYTHYRYSVNGQGYHKINI
ncbi:uncharacterized protein LOC128952004 [Oppia nitens]|uniref:uncharacterized protein LOC128952004 n=1 Tax=Oppia nitens TaxID=1686743 RepID=UPI0023DC14A5|nr:uncharacterized protein LOC128952004 [Oppia nitens]